MILKLPHYAGHRERARDKFLESADTGSLPDYEFLELILMRAIPRRDVKPLAKNLLDRFGTLTGVLTAPPDELMQFPYVKGAAVSLFKIIVEANRRLLESNLRDAPVLGLWDNMVDYCCLCVQGDTVENVMVLYLDTQYRLIRKEIPQKGTTNWVALYPREVLKRALVLGAHAVVVVHNHPSGFVQPSPADFEMTAELYRTLAVAEINLVDHLIIGPGRKVYSFGAHGRLTGGYVPDRKGKI